MDYRTGHSIISGTKYSLWPGERSQQRLIEIMVSFYKFNVIETAPGSGVYAPNTTVASAKVMILMV
jgi:hypothetical protein